MTEIVHQDLDLDIQPEEILAIVGGSGAGKSVLLRSIIGLNKTTSGEIKIFDED